jgi:hypothetical protein
VEMAESMVLYEARRCVDAGRCFEPLAE